MLKHHFSQKFQYRYTVINFFPKFIWRKHCTCQHFKMWVISGKLSVIELSVILVFWHPLNLKSGFQKDVCSTCPYVWMCTELEVTPVIRVLWNHCGTNPWRIKMLIPKLMSGPLKFSQCYYYGEYNLWAAFHPLP